MQPGPIRWLWSPPNLGERPRSTALAGLTTELPASPCCWAEPLPAAEFLATGRAVPSQLYEGRDLKPTTLIDALLAGALAGHFRLDPAQVAPKLFPGGAGEPMSGLIRA